jgi:hypothetical protein
MDALAPLFRLTGVMSQYYFHTKAPHKVVLTRYYVVVQTLLVIGIAG